MHVKPCRQEIASGICMYTIIKLVPNRLCYLIYFSSSDKDLKVRITLRSKLSLKENLCLNHIENHCLRVILWALFLDL